MANDERTPTTYRGGEREAQAWREVGHTDITPWRARALTAVFVAAVVVAPAVSLWPSGTEGEGAAGAWRELSGMPADVASRLRAPTTPEGAAGAWARVVDANRSTLARISTFEQALDRDSRPGRDLRPPTQRLLAGWLGAGNERVYIGRGGWTFFRADVEAVTGPPWLDPAQMARRVRAASEWEETPRPDPRPAITGFHRALAERGITLVVVPTPVKPTVHPERLARGYDGWMTPVQNPSFAPLVAELRRDGVIVVDPADGLVAARVRTGRPQYLATDTHWRPEAMEMVARDLATSIAANAVLSGVGDPGWRTQSREVRHLGDTAAMLDLPSWQSLYSPEAAWVRRIVDGKGSTWRPSSGAEVLLLGDSFTNIFSLATMGWGDGAGLAEQLAFELQRPIDRIVQNDAGAYATRERFAQVMREDPARFAHLRVVVWQFAAREFASGDWRRVTLPELPR